MAVTDLSGWC